MDPSERATWTTMATGGPVEKLCPWLVPFSGSTSIGLWTGLWAGLIFQSRKPAFRAIAGICFVPASPVTRIRNVDLTFRQRDQTY